MTVARAHIYHTSSKFSLSSFLSPLLAVQVSLCLLPLVWPGLSMSLLVLMLKVSGSLALWTWLSVLALYLLLSVCLQVPLLLSGSTLVLDPWLPWLVRVVEQYVVGDWLGLLSGWGALLWYTVASVASPKYNFFNTIDDLNEHKTSPAWKLHDIYLYL